MASRLLDAMARPVLLLSVLAMACGAGTTPEPVTANTPEAQAIVPVVAGAAVGVPTGTSTNARTRAAVRPINASSTLKPSVRRHRDSKPIPSHLDVIPNPYHD